MTTVPPGLMLLQVLEGGWAREVVEGVHHHDQLEAGDGKEGVSTRPTVSMFEMPCSALLPHVLEGLSSMSLA
jgi:hypothetical protein